MSVIARAGWVGLLWRFCFERLLKAVAAGVWIALALNCQGLQQEVTADFLATTWDSDDGLPTAQPNAFARTPDGYLWLATRAGLVRFDGVRFVTFTTKEIPALGGNDLTSLLCDSKGTLWVGGRKGTLSRRLDGKFTAIPVSQQLRRKPFNCLEEDASGAIWIATQGAGLTRYRNGAFDYPGPTNGTVSQILTDREKNLWMVSNNKLRLFDGAKWQVQMVPGKTGLTIERIAASSDGLWLAMRFSEPTNGFGGRLLKLSHGRWDSNEVFYPWPHANMTPRVLSMVEDYAGGLWLGTWNGGLLYYDAAGNWSRPEGQSEPKQISVWCLAASEAQGVWVGYARSGELQLVRRRVVKLIGLPIQAEHRRILSVCVGHSGKVWIGTSDLGMFCYSQGVIQPVPRGDAVSSDTIRVIFEDRSTNLWVGTWNGLFQFRHDTFEPVGGPEALRSPISSLFEDQQGNLWVGGNTVVRMGPEGIKTYGRDEGLAGNMFSAIEQDHEGGIWVASRGHGVYRLEGEKFVRYGAGQWDGQKEIRALYADSEGSLWIATWWRGLFRLKDGRFEKWTTADGLPSNNIHAIISDQHGNLWFSSDNGFFGCPRNEFDDYHAGRVPRMLFWRLTTADGLASRLGSGAGQPTVARSPDGRMWFPNQGVLAVFDPQKVIQPSVVKPLLIEEVLVDGQPRWTNENGEVRVKSGARNFEFHYTSPSFPLAERLQFRSRLLGFESDWEEAGHWRVARYGRLPPGKYRFQVMVGGPDGIWQMGQSSVSLVVIPAWFERTSVQVLGALLLLFGIAWVARMIDRARLGRRLRKHESRQALEKERRRIARDLHDDIGARLTWLGLQSEVLMGKGNFPPDLRTHMATMTAKLRELITAMDETVWAVNPRHDSISSVSSYIQHYAAEFFEALPIRCWVDVQPELPNVPLGAQSRHKLFLAVKEGLRNVAKHSNGSEVRLTVRWQNEVLTITIKDNGRGFDLAGASDDRNGLRNMMDRLKEIGGDCRVESANGRGCCVTLSLRVANPGGVHPSGG